MKKLMMALSVSVLALMGCDSRNANAQANQVSADVGSPQGTNTLIIQEGYTVVDPVQPVAPSGAAASENAMQPLPGDPGVDVAPLPEGNQPQPQTQPQAPADGNAYLIEETISTTTTQPMQ